VTVPGAVVPYPYGGKQREVMVNLDSGLLQSKGLSPQDVVNAVNAQNVIAPSGTAKIDQFEYDIATNSAPKTVEEMNNLPVKVVGNSTIYLRDVSHVSDGFIPQTNIVRQDGHRGVLETVIKDGDASTLSVVQGIRACFPACSRRCRRNSRFNCWRTSPFSFAPPSAVSSAKPASPPSSRR
jgi:multidrug efflux pump subunit AcrB